MPKPRFRKNSSFENTQTKSVFLYGNPNRGKLEDLLQLQQTYTNTVNEYIKSINNNKSIYVQLVNNDKHDSMVRKFEKEIRCKILNCALSQAAFDEAFTMLSNRSINIFTDVRSYYSCIFTKSRVLFGMAVTDFSQTEMISRMKSIADNSVKHKEYYLSLANELNEMKEEGFQNTVNAFLDIYNTVSSGYSIPCVKKAWVSLTANVYRLEEPVAVQADFVARISIPWRKGLMEIPVKTSRNSLRRMQQYGYASSAKYTITEKGQLRLAVAFTKKIKQPKTSKTIGVDTGIKDCLYASNGKSYGSMDPVIDYYKDTVEPSFAGLSDLRNKKHKILHYLKHHKDLPDQVRRSLLDKVDHLENMIQTAKEPNHKMRSYYHRLESEISSAVNDYIEDIDRETLTVIEKLDIREFHSGHRQNGRLSLFARGRIQHTLISRLNWSGYDFMEIDPAYTSQVCPVCSNLDKKNRNGKSFVCTACGYKDDADHNASVNIRSRADDSEILKVCEDNKYNKENRHTAIRIVYANRHNEWKKLHTDGSGEAEKSA